MAYLSIIIKPNATNKNVGDVSSVYSYEPKEFSRRQLLVIETDLPKDELAALTKSGLPESVVKKFNDEVAEGTINCLLKATA